MKILVAGDFCPQDRLLPKLSVKDFEILGKVLKTKIKEADFSIVNFECPIVNKADEPIAKIGPNLFGYKNSALLIKAMGFDVVTLANNHFRDYGEKGVECTLETFRNIGIHTVGGGADLKEARKMLRLENEKKSLTIINSCEHEFSIATEKHGGANPLDLVNLYEDIQNAKKNSQYILVILHGGVEHYSLPTPRMKKLFRHIIDLGADAVVNHHQHCYSGYEIYRNKPIFYGLGNFCFDRKSERNKPWNFGYAVELLFDNQISFNIFPYEQFNGEPFIKDISFENIKSDIARLNNITANDCKLKEAFEEYVNTNRRNLLIKILPFSNRWFKAFYRRGYLGDWLSRKKIIELHNLTNCESHLETYQYLFNLLMK